MNRRQAIDLFERTTREIAALEAEIAIQQAKLADRLRVQDSAKAALMDDQNENGAAAHDDRAMGQPTSAGIAQTVEAIRSAGGQMSVADFARALGLNAPAAAGRFYRAHKARAIRKVRRGVYGVPRVAQAGGTGN